MYHAPTDTCSQLLDSPRGQIVSQGFYNSNLTGLIGCLWEFKFSSTESATLLVDTYDMPDNCRNSSFEVVNFSGKQLVAPINTITTIVPSK